MRHAVFPATLAFCLLVLLQRQSMALTILSIREFSQSVGASSSFSRSSSSAAGAATVLQQQFTEDYSASFDYSILTPRFWQGGTMLDLEWLQYNNDNDGRNTRRSGTQLHYNINGRLLGRQAYPLSFAASSSRQTVSQSFAPSYESESDYLNARLSIQNARVPSEVLYYRLTQQNSGASQTLEQTTSTLSFSSRPVLGSYGSLTMDLSLTEGESSARQGAEGSSASGAAHLGYQTSWKSPENLSRSFTMSSGYQENKGVSSLTHQNVNGSLNWDFGKVLRGNLEGFYSKSSALLQETQDRGGSALLTHRLLGTLTSTLRGSVMNNSFGAGEYLAYSGGLGLNYDKLLPRASQVSVGYSLSMNQLERTGESASVQVYNEQHPIPDTLPRSITLLQPTFQAEGMSVVGAQTLLPYPASFYTIVAGGIELLDFFPGDTGVLISYRYLQDPGVTTVTTAQSISSALSLYNNKYGMYANASFSKPRVVKGDASALSTTGSSHYALGANARLGRHTLSSELGRDRDYARDQYSLTNSWGYFTSYAKGELSFGANDNLTWQSSQEGEDNPWVNAFTLHAGYRRNYGFLSGRFKADYGNVMLEGGDMAHTALLGANLEGKFGKITALLNSSASWSFSNGGNSSTQSIGISVRRTF